MGGPDDPAANALVPGQAPVGVLYDASCFGRLIFQDEDRAGFCVAVHR